VTGPRPVPTTIRGTPETEYAERGNIHIAYQAIGGGPPDVIFVSSWFSHLEGRWDIPSHATSCGGSPASGV